MYLFVLLRFPQVFGAQADHSVGALVQVSFANGQVDDGDVGGLVAFLAGIVEEDRAAGRFEGEVAEVGSEGGGGGRDSFEAGWWCETLEKKGIRGGYLQVRRCLCIWKDRLETGAKKQEEKEEGFHGVITLGGEFCVA